ncbi:MAG: HNH endonuclease [Gemmatimonadaceae bacterium]|nr:HNH endonuclease [Gemmatimonadaceae bacterium]
MPPTSAYLALTDPDWYAYLSSRHQLDEVNFWQPHGNQQFKAIPRGAPFFFKLRAPHKAIAGFGFFERFEVLPAWLAWQCFGQMNGAATFDEMVDRIVRLRHDDAPRTGDFNIGCIMIAAPVFFPEHAWVAPPNDWATTGIQKGKRYSTTEGEGQRILAECLERAARARYWNVDRVAEDSPRYGDPIPVRPRLGQGLFSVEVRAAYQGACAVTREHSAPVLEAAHIIPYAEGGPHAVHNGLLLRADLHKLLDLGYATVSTDYRFHVGERLREEYHNGRSYYALHGTALAVPAPPDARPSRAALEWHQRERFRG